MDLNEALDRLERAGKVKSRWLPGMLDAAGMRVFVVGSCPVGVEDGDTRVRPNVQALRHNARYDLSDPLTVMGLLLLAREAWGGDVVARHVGTLATGEPEWAACDFMEINSLYGFRSEAEAIIAALVAAAEAL